MSAKDKVLNLLFPEDISCIFCGEDVFFNEPICENCKKNIMPISGNICLTCGDELHSMATYCDICQKFHKTFKFARACFKYEGLVRKCVVNFKFNNCKYLAKGMAYFLSELYKNEKFDCDIIIPVPLSNKRYKQRGYNQSLLLANELGKLLNIKVIDNNLVKTKETKTQVNLNYSERQENLKNVFKVNNKSELEGKKILLIDDVYTTGATIESCTKALKKAKVKDVYALTFAHTELDL